MEDGDADESKVLSDRQSADGLGASWTRNSSTFDTL
jgi:hypothetical protein